MRLRGTLSVVLALAVLAVAIVPVQSQAPPEVTIRLVEPRINPSRPIQLAVGETITFVVEVESSEPFNMAVAMPNAYYPGRGVFWNGSDRVVNATTARLELTMTGKNATAALPAVCDWPLPGQCWQEGTAPVAVMAGARFTGGLQVMEVFAFAVQVP